MSPLFRKEVDEEEEAQKEQERIQEEARQLRQAAKEYEASDDPNAEPPEGYWEEY